MKIIKIKALFVGLFSFFTAELALAKSFYIYNKTFKTNLHIEHVEWDNCGDDKNFDIPINGTKTIKWTFGTCTLKRLRFRTPDFYNHTYEYYFNIPISRSGQCLIYWDNSKQEPKVSCMPI